MYHIQQNHAFLLFWIIFVEILRELHFLVKIVLSQEWALKYSEVLFFLNFWKGQILRKFWIFLNNFFWSNQ